MYKLTTDLVQCEILTVSEFKTCNLDLDNTVKPHYAKKKDKQLHYALPLSFDIETTKYLDVDGVENRAMFVWQFAYSTRYVVMGRTWEEFIKLVKYLNNQEVVYHIFVHNLSYEAHFMTQILYKYMPNEDWQIKLLKSRRFWEIKIGNVIFHDSMVITNLSLEKSAKDYNKKYFKAKGDFDYNKEFNILTPLTDTELSYCVLDVLSLSELIINIMHMNKYELPDMPKTQTGFVRRDVLEMSKSNGTDKRDNKYRNLFLKMSLNESEYKLCRSAFEGGFTAGSVNYYGSVIKDDIRCRDICSSYPYQLIAHNYPMGKFAHYEFSDFEGWSDYLSRFDDNCIIATYSFTNVNSITQNPHFSVSKCEELGKDYVAFNGKLTSTSFMTRTMTEIAFMDFIKYYTFDDITVDNIIMCKKAPLPKFMIDANYKYFDAKSTLKGVEGKEAEYLIGKQRLNGVYGMSATAIDFDNWILDINSMECENKQDKTLQQQLDEYYDNKNSFMSYQWACYVTSYARHQVFEMMDICGDNWLYTDTDSVYYISTPEIEEAFEEYNNMLSQPKSAIKQNGEVTTMGQVEPDGNYTEFIHLGAKKYCKRANDGLHITVAGVPKSGVLQLKDNIYNFHPDITFYSEDTEIDGELIKGTNKLRPEYIYHEPHIANVNGVLTETATSVNLKPCDYVLQGVDGDNVLTLTKLYTNPRKYFEKVEVF